MKYKITISHQPENEDFPFIAQAILDQFEVRFGHGKTQEGAENALRDAIKKYLETPTITKEIEI